jgi:tripartite-type tricarboxylate transporter receptor subunit TctC
MIMALGGVTAAPAAALQANPARAQGSYPDKPITFVVPFAPGGISDIMARAMGAAMSTDLGQPVVILNKPSPGLVLGLSEVAKAKPDGYTIGIWFGSAYTFPMTMKTAVPYDGIESFTFIHSYTEPLLGVVVKADAPWKTFQDLIDEGKRNPGKLKFGTVGVNSGQHVIMEIVMKATGARFVHVPQSGVAAGIANVLGGHLDFQSDASSWAPNVRQGQMRVLAVTGEVRSKFFPDAPTFKELGFKVVSSRGAVVGPAKLPEPIRAKLEAAVAKSLKSEKVKEAFDSVATEISSMAAADMLKLAIEDRQMWKQMLSAN